MTTIERIMKKGNRTRLIFGLLLTGVVVVTAVVFNRYLINMINGPYVVTPESLEEITSISSASEIYVTLEDVRSFDSGYYEYTTENGVRTGTSVYYSYIIAGEHLLLIKGKEQVDDGNKYTWTGELVPFSSDERGFILSDIEREDAETAEIILPFKLTMMHDFRVSMMIATGIGAVVLLIGLWYLSRWFKYTTNPESHPIMKKLSVFGDPGSVAQQIEMELTSNVEVVKPVQFTRNWLLHMTSSGFNTTRYQDIVWIYQKVVRTRYGKNYYASINDRFGRSFLIQAKEKETNAILQAVAQRAPWSVMGYDNDLQKAWNKNRDHMIAAVEQRKAELAQQGRGS